MIIAENTHLLYIEPKGVPSKEPLIDDLTKKMTECFRQASPKDYYKGFHECCCGASDSACDFTLKSGIITNSLCVHYLAFHRDEVPRTELAKLVVETLGLTGVEPTAKELAYPKKYVW